MYFFLPMHLEYIIVNRGISSAMYLNVYANAILKPMRIFNLLHLSSFYAKHYLTSLVILYHIHKYCQFLLKLCQYTKDKYTYLSYY